MVVEVNDNKVGYEEFDSSEFEPGPAADKADDEVPEVKAKDAKVEEPAGKLTPEEAFSDEPEGGKSDDAAAASDVSEVAPKDPKADASADGQQDATPAYEPNHKYTAYGKEKEFPDQLKSLVKDKASEDYVRDLLSKADGLDEMKPRHQDAVRERDGFKAEVEAYRTDINRIIELKDKQPHLFAAEMGLSDDWIIKAARQIVNAKETPEAWSQFDGSRQQAVEAYNATLNAQNVQQEAGQQFARVHQEQMSMALSHPEVSSFQSQFDAVHGLGSFQEEVRKHGYYHYERTRQAKGRGENLPPMDAVKSVIEFHKKTFVTPAPQSAAPAPVQAQAAPAPKREAPKPLPNVGGKGRNASPVGQRFKNLKEMRAYVAKHVEG